MSIQKWSEDILLVELTGEPHLSEELTATIDSVEEGGSTHVVLNLAGLANMNSSHIAAMLRLRAALINRDRHLRLCAVPSMIWGVMLVTGLDKVFEFSPDVPSALASLQLDPSA